ncbi:MAG: DUF1297 domain-containing protein [Candidatus Peribacteraceae bacterium]
MDIADILAGYDRNQLTIGALGGHSGLDIAHGAQQFGFRSVIVAQEGREKTYAQYFTKREQDSEYERGCIDEVILVQKFKNILQKNIQDKLKKLNTIFIHNRYFWVYFDDYSAVENDFHIPIFGNRSYVKLEERDQEFNQYHLLRNAGIRHPKLFARPEDIDRPVLVKAAEASRGYERAFFIVGSGAEWESVGAKLESEGRVSSQWRQATMEEFVVGAAVNFNFFYSPLTHELELMGTDTRRQTNLDGFLRMTAPQQVQALEHVDLKMIETGHIACTIKESLVEKALELGERFVKATQEYDGRGIIGPFALQGAVVAEDGREDIVIFDVSLRIPGSPGTFATPYSGYLYGSSMSVGERIALEIRRAREEDRLAEIVT